MKENKMKPKLSQKHPGPDWKGKGVNTSETTAARQSKQTAAQVRPFAGKMFYLDLQSNRRAEVLERDIKELGGTVEKFFSKDIRYLVSNKWEAKYVNCFRQDSPVPSPDSGQSSPQPHAKPQRPVNHVDNVKTGSQDQADTLVKSRGQSLVEKVVKEQGRIQMDRILSKALEWGVKILYIDDVLAYFQRKKKHFHRQSLATTAVKASVKTESSAMPHSQKLKGGRISKPFVKVEDSSRHYCPIYLTMPNVPKFNLKTAAPCSPFCLEDKVPPGAKQRGHRGLKASASEEKVEGRKKNRDKKRGGYCECCLMKYNNLKTHLQSECHKAFSKSDEYSVVDELVSALHFNFLPIKTKVERPKCSISSILFVPGPCGETDARHRGGADDSETVKVEERRTVELKESHPSWGIKSESSPGFAPQFHSKRDRWSCNTYSRHKSLPHKHTRRPNNLTFCARRAEQPQIPQAKSETPSSFPSRDAEVNQTPLRGANGPTSYLRSTNTENEVSAKSIHVTSLKDDDTKKDEALHEPKTGSNLTEKEEESPHPPNFSTVRRIQRRVRVYKHKRRKMDTNTPDDPLLRICELFQSSEDMDVEFHGFTDQECTKTKEMN
ncbi:protein DBF4 homolog A isoform X2 [Kryptolebias marmoratus]|uniref:Protein DBF4 homolog A n=1 Tax=Kryptolebias marmoratus TaxID=37003 RepID=A0A3Q2ZP52_KRYMA|nr:protein DBF4 homolog A isoform X2 [Kryptolebias marmoratus]